MSASPTSRPQPPLDFVPHSIVTLSILPFVSSDDWLSFRTASRNCYEIVHGTADVSESHCSLCQRHSALCTLATHRDSIGSVDGEEEKESEALWKLALAREFRFDQNAAPESRKHLSIHSPPIERDSAFLSTKNVFVTSTAFISWKHWRKIDRRLHHRHPHGSYIRPSERVVGPYFLRAASLWKKIEKWCDDDQVSGPIGKEIKASFLPGKPLDPNLLTTDGGEYDAQLSALKAVYAFYAGQDTHMYNTYSRRASTYYLGLFGGLQAYNFRVSMQWTEPKFESNSFEIQIANDLFKREKVGTDTEKTISMNLASGQVFATVRGHGRLDATPTTRKTTLISSVDGRQEEARQVETLNSDDSILRWFEEHARRLNRGYYSVGFLSHPPYHNLSLHSCLSQLILLLCYNLDFSTFSKLENRTLIGINKLEILIHRCVSYTTNFKLVKSNSPETRYHVSKSPVRKYIVFQN